jgi:hypothetical protein
MTSHKTHLAVFLVALPLLTGMALGEVLPESIQAPGLAPFLTLHAEGVQIYQCKPGPGGKPTWTLREPIASLMRDGVTVGRHFAGPTWELADGGRVQGQVAGRAPGATSADAPWLKLDVTGREGGGLLGEATVIQRVHTHGGALEGGCETPGALRGDAYSADYVFLKR